MAGTKDTRGYTFYTTVIYVAKLIKLVTNSGTCKPPNATGALEQQFFILLIMSSSSLTVNYIRTTVLRNTCDGGATRKNVITFVSVLDADPFMNRTLVSTNSKVSNVGTRKSSYSLGATMQTHGV